MKHFYDLTVFDEGPAGAQPTGTAAQPAAPAGGSQEPAKAAAPAGGYSYAQAEEIASARAQKAERAALASYFKQQGMTEDEATEAIKAYKAAQDAKKPDVDKITKERDAALAKVTAYEQREALSKKGVKPEFAEFVAFKARELMAQDDKLDTFDKAADKVIKDNPQYGTPKPAYRIKTSADQGAEGQKKDEATAAREALNAAIKTMARRK